MAFAVLLPYCPDHKWKQLVMHVLLAELKTRRKSTNKGWLEKPEAINESWVDDPKGKETRTPSELAT